MMKVSLVNNIGECPACGEDMEHCDDAFDDGKHHDSYTCWACHLGVTYISPDDGRGEYHLYRNHEIVIELEHLDYLWLKSREVES